MTVGKDAVQELEALYDIYDERLYIWMATLWEPEIGGFYFSLSARETEGFRPDINNCLQKQKRARSPNGTPRIIIIF